MFKEQQLTDTVFMVRPDYFGFNPETTDNTFQNRPTESDEETKNKALIEFERMEKKLVDAGLNVIELNSPVGPDGQITPDAVFPNNWVSTHPDALVLYPMKAQNRRFERQPEELIEALAGINVLYPSTIDLRNDEESGMVLEGTGSLVLDRENRIAYALESQRTNRNEFEKWCNLMGYEPIFFHAVDFGNKPVYHTNVVMSVGEKFAVVCTEAIASIDEREKLTKSLEDSGKEILKITMDQMYEMCGNVLQTKNIKGERVIVMSERARRGFGETGMKFLEKNGLIVPVEISTIETVGGGSARCMLAEVHF